MANSCNAAGLTQRGRLKKGFRWAKGRKRCAIAAKGPSARRARKTVHVSRQKTRKRTKTAYARTVRQGGRSAIEASRARRARRAGPHARTEMY